MPEGGRFGARLDSAAALETRYMDENMIMLSVSISIPNLTNRPPRLSGGRFFALLSGYCVVTRFNAGSLREKICSSPSLERLARDQVVVR